MSFISVLSITAVWIIVLLLFCYCFDVLLWPNRDYLQLCYSK